MGGLVRSDDKMAFSYWPLAISFNKVSALRMYISRLCRHLYKANGQRPKANGKKSCTRKIFLLPL